MATLLVAVGPAVFGVVRAKRLVVTMLKLLVLAILGVVMVTLLVLLVSAVLGIVLRGHDARAVGFSGIRCRHGPMFVALLILTSCRLFRNYRSEINKFI